MRESLVQQCLDMCKREDIKNEVKKLLKPVIDFIFYEINPYMYIILFILFLMFVMIVAILIILILLLRNNMNNMSISNNYNTSLI
jgi:hypothetical protein